MEYIFLSEIREHQSCPSDTEISVAVQDLSLDRQLCVPGLCVNDVAFRKNRGSKKIITQGVIHRRLPFLWEDLERRGGGVRAVGHRGKGKPRCSFERRVRPERVLI